jgi:hypothetical protein
MKNNSNIKWQLILGALLITLSVIVGIIHYELFHDVRTFFFYLVMDLAFIPLEVLVVTLILHNLLTGHEKRALRQKLNMVIGVFFSDVGTRLLRDLAAMDADVERIRGQLNIDGKWTSKDFAAVFTHLNGHHFNIEWDDMEFERMRSLLIEKRSFLLSLLENPNLLEHQSFTDLLWAVFHLTEELTQRQTLTALPLSDHEHLCGDVKRAYKHVALAWLDYMKHLKHNYPYLFSLAIRTNPFFEPNVTVKQ